MECLKKGCRKGREDLRNGSEDEIISEAWNVLNRMVENEHRDHVKDNA